MKSKKILIILNSDLGKKGTIGLRAEPTVKELNKKRIETIVFCRDYKKDLIEKYKYIKIIKVIPHGELVMKGLTALSIYVSKKFPSNKIRTKLFEFFLIQKLKKINLEEYQIVHSFDFLPEVFKFIKEKNKKIIIIKDMTMSFQILLKNNIKKEKKWKDLTFDLLPEEKKSLPYVDYYIVPSKNTEDSLILAGIKKNKIIKISYGVNTKIKPLKNKNFNDEFRVAFAGNINVRKGIHYLIDAWKKLNLKNAKLNLYGRIYPEIIDYLKDSEKYNIILHGFVDLDKELKKNHLLVHPSLLETTPKVLNEALIAGVPVITTYYSGPSFKNGTVGFIIKEQSSEEIAKKILFFYNNRDILKKMSIKANQFAKKKSWNDYGKEVVKNYLKLLKNNK